MKRLLSILLLVATVVPAMQAQIVRSTTLGEKQSRKTTWYVRAGLSMNNLTGPAMSEAKKAIKEYKEDGEDCSFGTRVGYDFEAGFMKYFGKTNLYWGMEFGLGTRGGKYRGKYTESSEGYSHTDDDRAWVDTYSIKYMPFQLGYMYPVTDKIKVDAHIGVYVSVDFAGKCKEKDECNMWSADSGSEVNVDEYEYNFDDQYVGGKRFDAGMQLGAGVWYDRFNLNFTWQRGFAPYIESFPFGDSWNGKSFQSSNIILSLGVSF